MIVKVILTNVWDHLPFASSRVRRSGFILLMHSINLHLVFTQGFAWLRVGSIEWPDLPTCQAHQIVSVKFYELFSYKV